MDIENVNKMIASLENESYRTLDNGFSFNMQYIFCSSLVDTIYQYGIHYQDMLAPHETRTECGSVGCLIGLAHLLFKTEPTLWGLATALKLKLNTARHLAFPDPLRIGDLYNITPNEAIQTLVKLRDTKQVDWSHVKKN